mgnify:CR=1 FL=1
MTPRHGQRVEAPPTQRGAWVKHWRLYAWLHDGLGNNGWLTLLILASIGPMCCLDALGLLGEDLPPPPAHNPVVRNLVQQSAAEEYGVIPTKLDIQATPAVAEKNYLVMGSSGSPSYDVVFSIDIDGNVELGPRATPDEAAKLFWGAVSMNAPPTCPPSPPPSPRSYSFAPGQKVCAEEAMAASLHERDRRIAVLEHENAHLNRLLGATRP